MATGRAPVNTDTKPDSTAIDYYRNRRDADDMTESDGYDMLYLSHRNCYLITRGLAITDITEC